jgi:superoxide dismutase, Cu-Zn family
MEMKSWNFSFKLLAAFLCGAVFFSGLGYAAGDHVGMSTSKISFFVHGKDQTSADGLYDNGGMKVPEAFIHEGTTYMPIRKAADLIQQPVYWESSTRSVSIGKPYVKLVDAGGAMVGHAILTEEQSGVRLSLEVLNLSPGKHGFHIHEKAFESNDFKTAGGHLNPDSKKHGHSNNDGHHLGDIDNLIADQDGSAKTEVLIPGATLEKGKPNSLLGRSIIIHAGEDDGKSDPAGNSGDRIVGGNIPE